MDTSTIQFAHTVVSPVDENGQPLEEQADRTDGRYSCTEHGVSWPGDDWPQVALHCLVEHAVATTPAKGRKG